MERINLKYVESSELFVLPKSSPPASVMYRCELVNEREKNNYNYEEKKLIDVKILNLINSTEWYLEER